MTTTRFDAEGRIIESSTPGAGASINTPRTTRTAYYTADSSSPVSACRAKPEWDGWTCQTSPGGAPSSGAPVPTETIAGYSIHGTATRTLETSGSTTRTVSSVLDYVGRATSESTTLGSETMTSTTAYATSTGLVTQSTGNGKTETYGYDSWGRQTSYTDGTGSTASTTYDTAGRVKTANDGKATTAYTYDGTDAAGKAERRGLVTKVDTSFDAGSGDVFTAAYDADGNIIRQNLPGGYETRWTRDVTGADTGLSYTKGGTEIMAFTTVNDHEGRTRVAYGPDGHQQYTYDDRDRLTQVKDVHRSACTTRAYEFSADSNRTRYREWAPTAGGACQSSTTAVDVSLSYDTADRVTNPGYVYDPLGRTTTVPKADKNVATDTGASNLTVGYHANDMVKSLSQSVSEDDSTTTVATQQTFSLDASDRVSVITEATGGVELARTTNHYDGSEDSPAWSRISTRPDANTAWSDLDVRNVPGIDGDLAITTSAESTILNLANPHGDVVMTIDLAEDIPSAYADYTEYGLPRASTPEHTSRYGWLGAKTRHSAGITAGLTLMGVRLYNPTTGRFLSTDPVAGGNDNTYVYPGDPINQLDLDGRKAWWKKAKTWRKVGKWAGYAALGACTVGTAGACGAASAVVVAANIGANRKKLFGKKVKRSSRAKAWGSLVWDVAGGAKVKGLRMKGVRGGKRASHPVTRGARWGNVYKSMRYSYRHTPRRKFYGRAAFHAASGYKTRRGW